MLSLTSEIRTPWHGVPAGVKLSALVVTTVAAFWLATPPQALLFLFSVAGLYLPGGRRFVRAGLGHMKPVLPFVAIILGWHALTGALAEGVVIVARMVALIALANLVTLTTRLQDMLARIDGALRMVAVPERPRRRLALAVALVIRFTPVLVQKGQALGQAWRARSPRRPGWRLLLPFSLVAIDEAERVAEALRARSGSV